MIELKSYDQVKAGPAVTFAMFFALVFLLVAGWPLWHGAPVRIWALVASGAFLVAGLVQPRLLAPLNKLWFRLGMVLGAIVSPVVMGLLFMFVFLPVGLLLRLRGHDLLSLKIDPAARTYWIARDADADAQSSMKNQF